MSITSLDGVLAGAQAPVKFAKLLGGTMVIGRPYSFFQLGGLPGAGTPNATLNGANYSSTSTVPAGCLYHTDPAGGSNAYLSRFVAHCQIACTMLLCDRLWDCQPAVNSTGQQNITQPTLPARDATGTTNGVGVQLAIETVASTSSTAAVISALTYTNSGGTGSRTGKFLDLPTAAVNVQGQFYRLSQQAGDQGVQSVQSITFSTAWTTGTICLVAYRVLATLELPLAWIPNAVDALTGGFPQLYNGVCPFIVIIPSAVTASMLSGHYIETQG